MINTCAQNSGRNVGASAFATPAKPPPAAPRSTAGNRATVDANTTAASPAFQLQAKYAPATRAATRPRVRILRPWFFPAESHVCASANAAYEAAGEKLGSSPRLNT